jgi:hypothetical protein
VLSYWSTVMVSASQRSNLMVSLPHDLKKI